VFVSYLLCSHYYQTTAGEKKASTVTVLSPELTKIIVTSITVAGLFSTVAFVTVYVTGEIKEMIAMSRPGSDEERKSLEKAEKFAFHTATGGKNGFLGRKSE